MAERYKIYDKLGAGGVGAVFRAYDNELKRWVAIKRLMSAKDASGDNSLASELRREADALAALRNPNIVTIFDVASDADGLFMVMELLEGEDLADVVERGPLQYDDFKELATQSLEALLAAHQRHILHRDIKPENIKVERLPGGRMQSKIIDFGLAREGMRARKQTEDQEGTVMGSIFYMAPEQLTREPVDVRTDLYALGCVFYESLSGRKAFEGETLNDVIDKHINHDIVPLNVIAPHVPPWLSAWVLRLMALNPADRPNDAQQAIEEFRAWEKMSAAPAMTPWMPPGYAQTQPLYPGSGTTGNIPVHPGYYQPPQPAAYAQPVLEVVQDAEPILEVAARTTPLSRPTAHAMRPSTPMRKGGKSSSIARQSSTRLSSTAEPSESRSISKANLVAIIAGAAVLLLAGGWFFLAGRGDHSSGGKASSGFLGGSGPPEVSFNRPKDRPVPPADGDLCVHLIAETGGTGEDGEPAGMGAPILEWHDVSQRGKDNFLRAYRTSADHAPRRIIWPAYMGSANVSLKPERSVLDFRPKDGPVSLALTDPDAEKAALPFGETPSHGQPGLTLGVVFQADESRLPMRLLTLSGDNDTSIILRIDKTKRLIADFRNGISRASITSRSVDPTEPCVAVLTWEGSTGVIEMRAKDASGRTYQYNAAKVRTPASALYRLQIGRVRDDDGADAPEADQFSGYLAELTLHSSFLKDDQAQTLESKFLLDHYLQTASGADSKTPSSKAAAPKAKKKK